MMLVVSVVDKTQREAERERERLASYSSVSVTVCHCHQDLLDAVDVKVLMKDFVGRSAVRLNGLETLEYYLEE